MAENITSIPLIGEDWNWSDDGYSLPDDYETTDEDSDFSSADTDSDYDGAKDAGENAT